MRTKLWSAIVCGAVLLSGGSAFAADNRAAGEWKTRVGQLAKPAPNDIVMTVVGDALWNHKMAGNDLRRQSMLQVMQSSDITFLNFEQVLADSGYPMPKEISKADPSIIEEFVAAGVNLVSVANNHMMDFGPKGLDTTLRTLESNGIEHSGAGATLAQSLQPAVIEKKGLKVALLSFLVAPNLSDLGTAATASSAGVAPIRGSRVRLLSGAAAFAPWDGDLKAMEDAIKEAKKTANLVAVSLHIHWGPLEEIDPEGKQLITRAAIDAGADMVLGHGPHVINGIELYKTKPIIYSIGNFAFQFTTSAYDFFPDSQKVVKNLGNNQRVFEAMMARMILSPQGKIRRIELLPLGLTREGDPHFVTGESANPILERLRTQSEAFKTAIKRESWYAVVDLSQG
ncbi:MAG: CapA family protein [Rhodospirillaceae bacterium]